MFRILESNPSHARVIADFQIAMALETEDLSLNPETAALGVQSVFRDSALGRYYVALDRSDRVIGCCLTTFEWSDWRNGTVLWIQSLYVIPEARRKGVYREMYAHLKLKVESDPALRGIRLYVEKKNVLAQKVYEKLGMSKEHYELYEWLKKTARNLIKSLDVKKIRETSTLNGLVWR